MKALISGQAGKAAVVEGDIIRVFDINFDDDFQRFSITQGALVFGNATDIIEVEYTSDHALIRKLHNNYQRDRLVLIFLSLFDPDSDDEDLEAGLELCENLLVNDEHLAYVRSRFWAYPLASVQIAKNLLAAAKSHQILTKLLSELISDQPIITQLRASWDSVSIDNFRDFESKNDFDIYLQNSEAFYLFAKAISSGDSQSFDKAKLKVFMIPSISKLPNVREIIPRWVNSLAPASRNFKGSSDYARLLKQAKLEEEEVHFVKAEKRPAHEQYQAVQQAKVQIRVQLQKLHLTQAQKYVSDLIKSQIENEQHDNAAKSLCSIAVYAFDTGHKAYALELNKQAVNLAPNDGRAWTELADAFLRMDHIQEASEAIGKARSCVTSPFVEVVAVKILKHQDFNQALKHCLQACQKFEGIPESWALYLATANLYREESDFDEAINWAQKAVQIAPTEWEPRCAVAALLIDIGLLNEGLKTYIEARDLTAGSAEVQAGIARSFREMGDFGKAEETLKLAMRKYPNDIILFKEFGLCLRSQAKTEEALKHYQSIKEKFPYDYDAYVETAYIYIELKKLYKVEPEFVTAIKTIEVDVGFSVKYARAMKAMGNTTQALHMFSQLVQENPNNVSVKVGQADILKELGDYKTALEFYERLGEARFSSVVKVSVAAIQIALGRKNIDLPEQIGLPRTKFQWMKYHILGMAMLKADDLPKAIEHFQFAIDNIPFFTQKQYFLTALSITKLRQKSYKDALDLVNDINLPVCKIIQLHAYAGLNRMNDARAVYTEFDNKTSSANIIYLKNEIGAQLSLNDLPTKRNSDWLVKREVNELVISASQHRAAA